MIRPAKARSPYVGSAGDPGLSEASLVEAATVLVDAQTAEVFYLTLTADRLMGNPSNPATGQMIMFVVEQDGVGGHVLTWSANYRFSADLPAPTLSAGAGKIDYLGFKYHAGDGKWDYLCEVKGF